MINFKILKKSKLSKARLGFIETSHGVVETPCLVPVATQAVIKTLDSKEVEETKSQILISNTFWLHLRPGEKIVEKVIYKEDKVFINKGRFFEEITEEVWKYQIGGYQGCDKWLKDRKGRILSLDDIRHYCKVVTAIEETIKIQKEIGRRYTEIEKGIIEFRNEKD